MSHRHSLVFTGTAPEQASLPSVERLRASFRALPAARDCGGFDVFVAHPEHERLTLFGDGAPPFVLVECAADDAQALLQLAADPALRAALRGAGEALHWQAEVYRVEREPVPSPGDDEAAPVALVVHYRGPVDDPAGFAAYYVANHPPILARLPGAREVLCYVPLDAEAARASTDATVIRNEVRFESMDALLAALRSPVLADLRVDARTFPRFGRSTHFPMLRRLAFARRRPCDGGARGLP